MAKPQTETTPSAPVAPPVPKWITEVTADMLAAAPVKGKKQRLCGRRFHNVDGDGVITHGSRAMPNSTQLDYCFADGEVVSVTLADIHADCIGGLVWRGLSEDGQNAFAKTDGATLGERCVNAAESLGALLENLKNGIWTVEGETAGPRLGQVVRAVVRALEAAGETVDDERVAAITEKLTKDGAREGAVNDPIIGAHYIDIQDEDTAKARDKRRAKLIAKAEADAKAETPVASKLADF